MTKTITDSFYRKPGKLTKGNKQAILHGLEEDVMTDDELVADVRRGYQEAYDRLVARYQARLHASALSLLHNHEDAHDVTQEAFLKAYLRLQNYRPGSSFYAWIKKIGTNLAIDRLRFRSRHPLTTIEKVLELQGHEQQPDRDLENKQLLDRIMGAVKDLPPHQQRAFLMREVEGLPFKDIAPQLGIPVSTATVHYFRARQALMSKLREEP